MPSKTRVEHDSLGEYAVPASALYGIYTARVRDAYTLSGQLVPLFFIRTYIRVKRVYSKVNVAHGKLSPHLGQAIQNACAQLLTFTPESLRKEFPIDIVQSGGGTATNMPVNEVIANLANESLGKPRGIYTPIHPNDHVNMSQSSNDTFPGVSKLVSYFQVKLLIAELMELEQRCAEKARDWQGITQVGRTHLQEAVAMPANGLWEGYAANLASLRRHFESLLNSLTEVPFGATAVGTQHHVDSALREQIVKAMRDEFGLPLRAPASYFQATSSSEAWSDAAGKVITLAQELVKMGNDLRLLSAGPRTGWREVILEPIHPGSSIMPGKVNPSAIEAVTMASWRSTALARSVQDVSGQAQLQLQTWWPAIAFSLYDSLSLITAAVSLFRDKVVNTVRPDRSQIHRNLQNSLVSLQEKSAELGYDATAEQVTESLLHNES